MDINSQDAFPCLKEMIIQDVGNLKDVWNQQLPTRSSSQLKGLKLERIVFSFNVLQRLQSLEELYVEGCDRVEEITTKCEEHVLEEVAIGKLYQLRKLSLQQLPKLTNVWRQETLGFPNLTCINIYKCNSLRSLFSPSLASSLVQLQELSVSYCDIMEAIIIERNEEETMTKKNIMFPHLRSLSLGYLPSLVGFYNSGIPHPQILETPEQDKENQYISTQALFDDLVCEYSFRILYKFM